LTGKEKSIFGIFQADLEKYPEFYEGVDVNEYYSGFKAVNNLNGRKLKRGEELMFPDTAVSIKIREAEAEKAAAEEAARNRAETAESPPDETSSGETNVPAEEIVIPEEVRKKSERSKAVYRFQHAFLPRWVHSGGDSFMQGIAEGNIDHLVRMAQEIVDEAFAESLALHAYPEKNIYVIEFEKPAKGSDCFFAAIREEGGGNRSLYTLEKGISVFGAGDPSVFCERKPDGTHVSFGGRDYTDLNGFLSEIEQGAK